MNTKILLINPPFYRLQGFESAATPVGICYVAAPLEEAGIDVEIWHSDFKDGLQKQSSGSSSNHVEKMTETYNNYRRRLADKNDPIWLETREVIRKSNPGIIGISVMTSTLQSAINISRIAREINPDIKIVFGGVHPTIAPNEVIKLPEVDFVIRGEGEYSMLELVRALETGGDLSAIRGLIYKTADGIKENERRDLIPDLNTVPLPAKHKIINYEKLPPNAFEAIYGSRGCPFQCIFCGSHNLFGRVTRYRSPENVISEIKDLIKRFDTYNIFFCDDTFPLNKVQAHGIMDLIIKEKLPIIWSCQTRPECLDEELIKKMKASGCQKVSFGVESGSERIRKLIKKGNTKEQLSAAAKLLRKHGIQVSSFWMFGFPTETKEDIEETLKFLEELNPNVALCNIVTAAPGTELMDLVLGQNLISYGENFDWSKFYHQSPEMFFGNVPAAEKDEIINRIQKIFDQHNKRNFRRDLVLRFGTYMKMIYREKLYRHPGYLLGKLRDAF